MEVYGDYMRPRRGRPRAGSHRCGASQPRAAPGARARRCWLDKLCNLLIVACLLSSAYWTLEYHGRSCNAKCDFRVLTRQINDISKNLSYMRDNYLDLEQKMDILTHDLPRIEGQVEILETLAQTLGRPSNWEIRRPEEPKRKRIVCKGYQPARGELLSRGREEQMGDYYKQGRDSPSGGNLRQDRNQQMRVNSKEAKEGRQGREPQTGVNLRQERFTKTGEYPRSGRKSPKSASFMDLNETADEEELYYEEEIQGSEVVVNSLIHEPFNKNLRSYSDRIIF